MGSGSSLDVDALLAHRSFVAQLARSLLKDGNDADDVAQQTWRSVVEHGDEPIANPRGWLARITRHHAFNLVRGRNRRQRRDAAVAGASFAACDPASIAERVELTERVVRAVLALEEPYRATLLLRFYDDMSTREIAQAHDVSIDTVRWRIERGVESLRRALDAKHSGATRSWRKELALLVGASAVATSTSASASIAALASVVILGVTLAVWGLRDEGAKIEDPAVSSTSSASSSDVPDPHDPLAAAIGQADPAQPVQPAREEVGIASSASGEFVLRIGDGVSFGAGEVQPQMRDDVDVYCLDQRDGSVWLRASHGAAMASSPMTALGLPSVAAQAAQLVLSAPRELAPGDLVLTLSTSVKRPGVGFVRAKNGAVYRVHVAAMTDDADALLRSARIVCEAVPSVDGGGLLHLPTVVGQPSGWVLDAIRRAVRLGDEIPGQSFPRYLDGAYVLSSPFTAPIAIEDEQTFLVVESSLDTAVSIDSSSGLVAAAGVGGEGALTLRAYGAIGVLGPMNGTIDVKSYGYVYLAGPLNGTLNIDSYATVVLEGDLVGSLRVRSYTDLLLRGRIFGALDTRSSGWCDFWFDGYWTAAELETLGKEAGQVTLHVRQSDLPIGEHEGFGGWRRVIVGEAEFDRFPR